MDISIVIPTWRGRSLLEAYLPSVIAAADFFRSSQGADTEIIVVEDAGGDDTIPWLRSHYGEKVILLEHEQNLGFCAACLTGFTHARFPIVLLLNNDVRLKTDCIASMIGHFKHPDVFAVTGKLLSQEGDVFCNGGKIGQFRRGMWSSFRNYDVLAQAPEDLSCLSFAAIGAFSAYDREKFLQLGGFEPLTVMYEDVDISYRGWKRGWMIKYEPGSVAYHDASQTMKQRFKRRSRDLLTRRSRIVMHWMLLHDKAMFGRHLAFMALLLLTSWMWLDWTLYWALFTSFRHIGEIRRKRKEARRTAIRSDRDLLQLLNHFYQSAPIKLL